MNLLSYIVALSLTASPVTPEATPDLQHNPEAVAPSYAGVVRGRLVVEERPARRRSRGYAAGSGTAQAVPRVVWIDGELPGAPPTLSQTPQLPQEDTAFAPAFLTIPVGGSVGFPNRDPFFHNVFSYSSAARFDLGAYGRGETKEVVFELPGMVKVFCEVHDEMRAAILVVTNRFWAEVGADGVFEFSGVPDGIWTLVGWDVDRGEVREEIRVVAGQILEVELSLS